MNSDISKSNTTNRVKNTLPDNWIALNKRLDARIGHLLESLSVPSERLYSALQYVLLSNGKRMRPVLIYLTGKALGLSLETLDAVACAIECMHAYSLIHDDLPAMDNDDLRRGKPTCHRAFDEATAILAGDALQALAFQYMLQNPFLMVEQKNAMAITLSQSCGAEGMVSGQSLDLEHLGKNTLTRELLQQIHALKTGVLFQTCIDLAIIAKSDFKDSNEKIKENLRSFSRYFGLAFQIQDDYLDAYGQTEQLGKQQGADKRQGKKTYVNFYSQENLKQLVDKTYQQALTYLYEFPTETKELIEFTQYLMGRAF